MKYKKWSLEGRQKNLTFGSNFKTQKLAILYFLTTFRPDPLRIKTKSCGKI